MNDETKKAIFKSKNIYDFSRLTREEKIKKYIYSNIDFLCNLDIIDRSVAYNVLEEHMHGKADFSRLLGSLTTAGLFIESSNISVQR